MPYEEEFTGEVRARQGKYFDMQIPPVIAKLLQLKKGTIVRVKMSVAKEVNKQ